MDPENHWLLEEKTLPGRQTGLGSVSFPEGTWFEWVFDWIPLPFSTPCDTRHVCVRQREKERQEAEHAEHGEHGSAGTFV